MNTLDLLATAIYGICGGLRVTAELAGYWLLIVIVYYICTDQLHHRLMVGAALASVVIYFIVRIVMEWLE